jgi:1-acyl-sn-glycerol-3-phosphate acyltransferase
VIRAALFYTGFALLTVVFALLCLFVLPLPVRRRLEIIARPFCTAVLRWLKLSCNLSYRVKGLETLPAGPAIILCKHQSAFETLALQAILPPQVTLLKRELLFIPVWGWGLASLNPIAIVRESPRAALRRLLEAGKQRLSQGLWIAIYPEGTRVAPGERKPYLPGGGLLAEHAHCPVVPVAHNAGLFWPRQSFAKRPGTVDIVIGPAIAPEGQSARSIMTAAEQWIEQTSAHLLTGPEIPPPSH